MRGHDTRGDGSPAVQVSSGSSHTAGFRRVPGTILPERHQEGDIGLFCDLALEHTAALLTLG